VGLGDDAGHLHMDLVPFIGQEIPHHSECIEETSSRVDGPSALIGDEGALWGKNAESLSGDVGLAGASSLSCGEPSVQIKPWDTSCIWLSLVELDLSGLLAGGKEASLGATARACQGPGLCGVTTIFSAASPEWVESKEATWIRG
jgi:hypothetical protein